MQTPSLKTTVEKQRKDWNHFTHTEMLKGTPETLEKTIADWWQARQQELLEVLVREVEGRINNDPQDWDCEMDGRNFALSSIADFIRGGMTSLPLSDKE